LHEVSLAQFSPMWSTEFGSVDKSWDSRRLSTDFFAGVCNGTHGHRFDSLRPAIREVIIVAGFKVTPQQL